MDQGDLPGSAEVFLAVTNLQTSWDLMFRLRCCLSFLLASGPNLTNNRRSNAAVQDQPYSQYQAPGREVHLENQIKHPLHERAIDGRVEVIPAGIHRVARQNFSVD